MKITSINIEGFKSIKNERVVGFGDINMISGPNNSGKSNFFDIISTVFAPKHEKEITDFVDDNGKKTTQLVYSPTPFHSGHIYNKAYLINIDPSIEKCNFQITIQFDDDDFGKHQPVVAKNDFYWSPDGGHDNIIGLKGTIREVDNLSHLFEIQELTLNNEILLQKDKFGRLEKGDKAEGTAESYTRILDSLSKLVGTVPTNRNILPYEKFSTDTISPTTELSPANLRNYLFGKFITAESNIEFENFIKFLKQVPIPNRVKNRHPGYFDEFALSDIELSFAKMEENIALMVKSSSKRLPISNYGTGVQQILLILSYVFFEKPKVILIEEFELNLSVAYQELLIHYLREYIKEDYLVQVFFTTHSDPYNRKDFRQYTVKLDSEKGTLISLNH